MTASEHRCKCGAMLVDVREPDGSIGRRCPACEALELVDVVRQLFVAKRGA